MEAMEGEHASITSFTASNYGLTTWPRKEWEVVINADQSVCDGHRVMPNYKRLLEEEEQRWKQEQQGGGPGRMACLQTCEIVALILYTGPMVTP